MKTRTLLATCLALGLGLNFNLLAQGTAFTYQGRLQEAGSPANGNYDFRFRIASDALGNNYVGSPFLTNAVPVSAGLFTVTLDFGNQFTGANRWLEIGVRTNGGVSYTTLTPLQALTATPYAVMANSASNLLGTLPAAQLSGALPSSQLAGTYSSAVTLNNAANSFSGSGAGLTGLNASQLTSGTVADARLSGNVALLNSSPSFAGIVTAGGKVRAPGLEVGTSQSSPGFLSSISGGLENTNSSGYASIGGGYRNYIQSDAYYAVIAGGNGNLVESNADYSSIGGGAGNLIPTNAQYATIPGGKQNAATNYAFAAGRRAKARHEGAFVWADSTDADFTSGANNQFLIRAAGGVGIGTNNPQSALHVAGAVTADRVVANYAEPPAGVIPVVGMVWIRPGTFIMGSRTDELGRDSDEGPQTVVTLTRGFWMGAHEVTQGEYLAVIGSNPSNFTGDTNRPVESVIWGNATNYCGLLTQAERTAGRIPASWAYRLPTEAEWEYCCRAGPRTTRFSYGDDVSYAALTNYAWFQANSGGTTHPVEQKLANPWGLMDMHGNVSEWCQDWYASYPGGSVTDPQGPGTGSTRVIRDGSVGFIARASRSARRGSYYPDFWSGDRGFRVVLAPQ